MTPLPHVSRYFENIDLFYPFSKDTLLHVAYSNRFRPPTPEWIRDSDIPLQSMRNPLCHTRDWPHFTQSFHVVFEIIKDVKSAIKSSKSTAKSKVVSFV